MAYWPSIFRRSPSTSRRRSRSRWRTRRRLSLAWAPRSEGQYGWVASESRVRARAPRGLGRLRSFRHDHPTTGQRRGRSRSSKASPPRSRGWAERRRTAVRRPISTGLVKTATRIGELNRERGRHVLDHWLSRSHCVVALLRRNQGCLLRWQRAAASETHRGGNRALREREDCGSFEYGAGEHHRRHGWNFAAKPEHRGSEVAKVRSSDGGPVNAPLQ